MKQSKLKYTPTGVISDYSFLSIDVPIAGPRKKSQAAITISGTFRYYPVRIEKNDLYYEKTKKNRKRNNVFKY